MWFSPVCVPAERSSDALLCRHIIITPHNRVGRERAIRPPEPTEPARNACECSGRAITERGVRDGLFAGVFACARGDARVDCAYCKYHLHIIC